MNHYVKLVNFEVKRFWKLFCTLLAVVIVAQIVGAIVTSLNYMNDAKEIMRIKQLMENEYVHDYGPYSMNNFLFSEYFLLSIVFAAAILIIYVFFIWYRDWLGKSSFIYRLLMVPTERLNVYFAKLTTILLFVFLLVGMEIVLLEVAQQIIQLIIPEQLWEEQGIMFTYSNNDVLAILYPQTALLFVLTYGIGATIVAVVFTAILLERSYHFKGIFMAAIYTILSIVIITLPLIVNGVLDFFYYYELVLLMFVSTVITLGLAIYVANYLLKRKITV